MKQQKKKKRKKKLAKDVEGLEGIHEAGWNTKRHERWSRIEWRKENRREVGGPNQIVWRVRSASSIEY